jgi:hypothetical protein
MSVLIGLQGGYTKFCCFLCEWDSKAKGSHYVMKNWPNRTDNLPGRSNVISPTLVEKTKIFLPPLHIKLGLTKNFVKCMDTEGEGFAYLKQNFPQVSDAKIKEGIFVGPQIRALFGDSIFTEKLNKF